MDSSKVALEVALLETEAQLTATLEHLKAVLGDTDRNPGKHANVCIECRAQLQLVTQHCINPACILAKAREHVKELEGSNAE